MESAERARKVCSQFAGRGEENIIVGNRGLMQGQNHKLSGVKNTIVDDLFPVSRTPEYQK